MNVLMDKDLGAKLADFAGGSIDGSPVLVAHGQPSISPAPAALPV